MAQRDRRCFRGSALAFPLHNAAAVKVLYPLPRKGCLAKECCLAALGGCSVHTAAGASPRGPHEYIVLRRGRNRRRLTPPRVAAPAVMTGHENDPRSSSSVEKRRARARAQALATQGSPLTAVAQRWKRWRTRGSMPAAPPAASRPKSSLGDGQLLYGLLEAACETPFLRRRPTRDVASSARGLRRSRR